MEDYVINKYKFSFNEENYIDGFGAVAEGEPYDWEGQAADVEQQYGISLTYGCFKFENGNVVFDNEKYEEIRIRKEKLARINELKALLTSTDYIYNSIREGGRTEEYYAEVIENRKAWRREIQELEAELGI